MDQLGYTSPEELLAEKFHMSKELLRKLNPGVSFDKPGEKIVVSNVGHDSLPAKIARVEVDAKQRLKAYRSRRGQQGGFTWMHPLDQLGCPSACETSDQGDARCHP